MTQLCRPMLAVGGCRTGAVLSVWEQEARHCRGQVGWQKLACFQPACVSQLWQVQVLKSKLAQKVAFA